MKIRCFIITGASKGLGKALKEYVLNETNDHVVSLSRTVDNNDESESRIKWFPYDLSSDLNFSFIDFLRKSNFEELVLIHNAGVISPIGEIGKLPDKEVISIFKINYLSPVLLTNKMLSDLGIRMTGIINISSGAANRPLKHWAAYCSTKSALKMFFDTLTIERPDLNVLSIDPGVLDTSMQKHIRSVDFPDVELFKSFLNSGSLKSPRKAAYEIMSSFL